MSLAAAVLEVVTEMDTLVEFDEDDGTDVSDIKLAVKSLARQLRLSVKAADTNAVSASVQVGNLVREVR